MLTRRNKQGAKQVMDNGGMMDEAGQVVNGTEVPTGSLAEEVADDVPAMLSEGEFVVPADVVRFVGLERLMKMRDKAKEGLERMEEVGQMGNAEEVGNPDQQFAQADDIAFENDIDSIIGEVDNDGAAMQTEQMFAAGGYVSGSDIDKAVRNPAVDVRYYKHADGRMMYITFINDKPMTAIPDGFNQVSAEDARQVGKKADDAADVAAAPVADAGGGGGGEFDPFVGGEGGVETRTPGQTGVGSSYVKTDYQFTPQNIVKGVVGLATMNPMLIASAIQSIAKTKKQSLDMPKYNNDMMLAAKEVSSGKGDFAGSPFGSLAEAKAIADFGFMSDQHFDAVISTTEAAIGSPGNLGTPVTIGGPISSPDVVGTPIGGGGDGGGYNSSRDYDGSSNPDVTVGGPISSPDVVGTPLDGGGGGYDFGSDGYGGYGSDDSPDGAYGSSPGGPSGGGNGGGSSKIVCTAMNESYGFGSFRQSIWLRYSAEHLTKEHEVGYHAMFMPLVKAAYKEQHWYSKLLRSVLEHIARHRTADIRAEMRGSKRSRIGQAYRIVFEPVCYIVGKLK